MNWDCKTSERYLVAVKEDMQEVGARESEVDDRSLWRISWGDCQGKKPTEEFKTN